MARKSRQITIAPPEPSNEDMPVIVSNDTALQQAKELLESSQEAGEVTNAEMSALAKSTFKSHIPAWAIIVIIVALVVAFFGSFMMGRYPMTPIEVVQTVWDTIVANVQSLYTGFLDYTGIDENMFRSLFFIRLPRILIVMVVGAALSIAGASYQGMFKNPLTSPDLLGAAAGASVGACIGLLLNMGGTNVQILAFIGGLVTVGCTMWLTRLVEYDAILGLVLAGILVSNLFNAVMSIIKLVADGDNKLPEITYWLMGSFADADSVDIIPFLIPMAIGFALLLFNSRNLNVLSFGDEEARSMGISTGLTRTLVILGATLVTSVSVAVAGIVGWIGLVVPHLARAIVGPNYKVLLPISMLVGAIFLLLVDDVSRVLMSVETPIGILTSILGVPFFVFIFRRNMRGWQ